MLWHNNERGYNTVGRILKVAMYLLKHSTIKIHFLHTFAIHRHYSCQILLQDTFCTSPYLLFCKSIFRAWLCLLLLISLPEILCPVQSWAFPFLTILLSLCAP